MIKISLTTREKTLLLFGAAFLVLLLGTLGYKKFLAGRTSYSEKIGQIESDSDLITSYGKEYQVLSGLRKGQNIDLAPMTGYIESLLQRFAMKERVTVVPNDTVIEKRFIKKTVSINWKEIKSESILLFIKEIEDNQSIPMTIEYFNSRPLLRTPGYYTVSMKIAAYKNKE